MKTYRYLDANLVYACEVRVHEVSGRLHAYFQLARIPALSFQPLFHTSIDTSELDMSNKKAVRIWLKNTLNSGQNWTKWKRIKGCWEEHVNTVS